MFCSKCGTSLPDNAKFCFNCGNDMSQFIQQIFTPAPEAPAAPVSEAPAAEVSDAPAPETLAQEIPTAPAAEVFAAPAPEAPVAPAAPAPDINTSELPMPGGIFANTTPAPAAPVQQNYGMPAAMPAQPVYEAPAPVIKPKKKGKAGLIAGVTAAAVVAGGGGVGYFMFHDDITRMVMGESGYAQMVSHSAFEDIENETGTAGKYISRVLSSSRAKMPQLDMSQAAYGSIADALASPITTIADMSAAVSEGTSLSYEFGFNVSAGSAVSGMMPDGSQEILDLLNDLTFSAKQVNGTPSLVSFGISDSAGNSGSIELYKTSRGDIVVAFPGISDKTIEITKEKLDEVYGESAQNVAGVKFSDAEAKRLLDEIIKIYYESYDKAQITYTDGVSMSCALKGADTEVNISVTGTEAKVVFTGEQMLAIAKKTADLIANDDYVKNFVKEAYGMDEAELAESLEIKDTDASKLPTVTVSHIVDVHNNVLASSVNVKFADSSQNITLRWIDNEKNKYVAVDMTDTNGTHYLIQSGTDKKSETDGNSVFSYSQSGKNEFDVSFDCAYSGCSSVEWLDGKIPVGKFEIKLSDPEAFAAQLRKSTKPSDTTMQSVGPYMGDMDDDKLIDELKKLKITSEASASGNKYSASFYVSVGDIGSVTIKTDAETSSGTVTLPAADNIDLNDTEALSGLLVDAAKLAKKFIGRYNTINMMIGPSLDSIINANSGNDPEPPVVSVDPEPPVNPDDPEPPVVIDDHELTPEEMDSAARELSGQMEQMLGDSGMVAAYTVEEADQLLLILEYDGVWQVSGVYADKREKSAAVVADELWKGITSRLNALSDSDSNLKGLRVGYYFSDYKYVGDLVMQTSYNADFDLYGLPDADNIRSGIFAGWYSDDEHTGESGYFADYDGNTMYVGTYCLSTEMPLCNPEEVPAQYYTNFDGSWEVVSDSSETFDEGDIVVSISGDLLMIEDSKYQLYFRDDTGDLIMADIYDYADNDKEELLGNIEFGSDGESAVITDGYTGETLKLRKADFPQRITADMLPDDFGEVKEYPEISDIVGVWTATEPDEDGDYIQVAVSSDAILGYYGEGSGYFVYLNPREGGFDTFAPEAEYEMIGGSISYSEETDKMFISFDDETAFTFERTSSSGIPPYYGKWKLDPLNPPDDVQYVVLDIDEYFLVLDYEYHYKEYYIIRDVEITETGVSFNIYMDNFFDDDWGYRFEYDHGADTIKMTEFGFGDETPMQFVRTD